MLSGFFLGNVIKLGKEDWEISQEDDESEDWKTFYDDRFGLGFSYPSDCTDLKLLDFGIPSAYYGKADSDNGTTLVVNVNPTSDYYDTPVEEEDISIGNQIIKIVLFQDKSNSKYIARMDYGNGIETSYGDIIEIQLYSVDKKGWDLYKEIVKSVNVDEFYRDWKVYEDKELGFYFKYPATFDVNYDWNYSGIHINDSIPSMLTLLININNGEVAKLKKVHKENIEIINENFNGKGITEVEVYCTMQETFDDVSCSSEEPVPNTDSSEGYLEGIYYSEEIEKEGDFYLVGNYSKERDDLL